MRMIEQYNSKAVPALIKEFGYRNTVGVPRLKKVVVNTGLGKLVATAKDPKVVEAIGHDLSVICCQKAVETKAKKSIAGFKLRKGMTAGFRCTLRGERMYSFLERLINVAMPRTRDFRGLNSHSIVDGTMTIAIREHIVFPEVVAERVSQIFGFEVSIVTDAASAKETEALLRLLGFPIKKK